MKKTNIVKRIFIIILFVLIAVFCIFQNNHIVITRYNYQNDKISQSFDEYKIVQISDLHNKMFGADCKRLVSKIKAENPNMIVITGDLVDSIRTNLKAALIFVSEATKIAPVYFVTGNHESELDEKEYSAFLSQMRKLRVNILENETVIIKNQSNDYFFLTGLRDPDSMDDTLNKITQNLDTDIFNLLLSHEPQYIKNYSSCNIDLVLSGHTHGGQIRLPFINGIYAPGQGLFPKYIAGRYEYNQTSMIISRGLGNSAAPLRIFNYPEIVALTLNS